MAAYFAKCEEKLGFVPNVLKAYAFDTAKLSAFVAMYNDLMLAPSGLSKLEREMIAVAVSAHNRCYYCLVAHGAAVRAAVRRSGARRTDGDELSRRAAVEARARHARLRRQAHRRAVAGRGGGPRGVAPTPALPIATSGTSPRSPASSTCRTALPRRPTCGRTASITRRRGDGARRRLASCFAPPHPDRSRRNPSHTVTWVPTSTTRSVGIWK